nr:MAG TPA: GTPase-activating protein [Caudoviricetes sp.]
MPTIELFIHKHTTELKVKQLKVINREVRLILAN